MFSVCNISAVLTYCSVLLDSEWTVWCSATAEVPSSFFEAVGQLIRYTAKDCHSWGLCNSLPYIFAML